MARDQEILDAVAEELREIADELESGDIRLDGPVRYTQVYDDFDQIPPEVEFEYHHPKNGRRHVEVWS